MRVIGLDIGGANIKASDGEQLSLCRRFPLWKEPDNLPSELNRLVSAYGKADALAVTMTGELADCYANKDEGVAHILSAVREVANVPIHVWQTAGEFVPPDVAEEFAVLTAAANWHALATWAGRMAPEDAALLVDVGSTTTDIIPLLEGMPVPEGRTDLERLLSRELVYTGVRRTPICAVATSALADGCEYPLAAELFSTTLDLGLILGDQIADVNDCDTADGRPATRGAAIARLARMLCSDTTELPEKTLVAIAASLREHQVAAVSQAIQHVLRHLPQSPHLIVLSGEGEFLARLACSNAFAGASPDFLSLQSILGPNHSQAACAYALARLGVERLI